MNIHNRLMKAQRRIDALTAAILKAKIQKEGAIRITAYDLVNDLNDHLMKGNAVENWYYAAYTAHYGPIGDKNRKYDFHRPKDGYLEANEGDTYTRGAKGSANHFKEVWIKLGDDGTEGEQRKAELETYFEGGGKLVDVDGIRIEAVPMFPLCAEDSTFGEALVKTVTITYDVVNEEGEKETRTEDVPFNCYYPEYWLLNMEWGDVKSKEIYPGVCILDAMARDRKDYKDAEKHGGFGMAFDVDGFVNKLKVDITTVDEFLAARIVAYLILGKSIRPLIEESVQISPVVAAYPFTINEHDFSLCVRAGYADFVAANFEVDWNKELEKQFPAAVEAGLIFGEPQLGVIGEIVSNEDLVALLSGFEKSAKPRFYSAMRDMFALKRAMIFKEAEEAEAPEEAEDAEELTDEEDTMETPAEVQKAMRLIKAWNAFKKEAENGVTSGAQFNMDGANDSEGENPAYSQQDANDMVDEEYTEEMAPSAIDETGLAGEDMIADEDMTVDSADAVTAVPAVAKSMRRLGRKLLRKAEEADPEMTEEDKEEAEDAIADDLKDPEATEEIAECMKAEGDEELADELKDHAELLEKARKSLFAKTGGDVGAVALPSEEVGVATESVVDKSGEQNDTDMPPSAVDEAGTDKIDVNADLEDNEVAKVDDEPEKKNPGMLPPDNDVPVTPATASTDSEADDKELAKAYRMIGKSGMSITDMIAAKRGQRIEDSEEEGYHPTSANGYRTVRMGDGKIMFPPMKH